MLPPMDLFGGVRLLLLLLLPIPSRDDGTQSGRYRFSQVLIDRMEWVWAAEEETARP